MIYSRKLTSVRDCRLEPHCTTDRAHNLIHEYACIFLWNDLDLGKTLIVKHSIKLTDPTPFKECIRDAFAPVIYEEVRTHIQRNASCRCYLTL